MALSDKTEHYKKWQKIEENLLLREYIPINIFKQLEQAYKNGVSEQEQEEIINNIYNQLFTSDMEG